MQPYNLSTSKKPILPKTQEVFIYLLLLTGFFLLLEISYFIQCNQAYLSDYTFVSNTIHIPAKIIPGILFFIFAQLAIHFLFAALIWCVTQCVAICIPQIKENLLIYAMVFWGIGVLTVLFANQVYFPNSKFSDLMYIIFNASIAKLAFFLFAFLSGTILLLAFAGFLIIIKRWVPTLIFIGIFSLPIYFNVHQQSAIISGANISKPNIFIIGVDSLRPDFINYFGADNQTPFLNSFLNQATVFTQAVTPIARTFPSWISILTGQYPLHTGIRTNLSLQNHLPTQHSLGAILKEQGYETVYATDETRFSNISTDMGFDRVVSPPVGLNDFLIGTFNDFPLSNLFINTVVGKIIFPYSYANRPAYFAYEPNTFLQLLKPTLSESHTKPLFLSIHFCLTHYPYIFARESGRNVDALTRYQKSVQAVDAQLNSFFTLLKTNHLLDHAIVVLLSDHGEALELPGDRITDSSSYEFQGKSAPVFYPANEANETVDESAGHGTDVLGLTQYHSLLAFRLFGVEKNYHRDVTDTVTLLDIKPTLLSLMQLPIANADGQSLAEFITKQHPAALRVEPIFMESDFSPAAIRTVYPQMNQVILDGLTIFQIDPKTTRLFVKPDMNAKIIQSKQLAVIYKDWVLALYPQNNATETPILVNLSTGEWTDDLHSPFAKQSPAIFMLNSLHNFYR